MYSPSKLTIVILTQPSRTELLRICLDSVRETLNTHHWINLILVLNGTSEASEHLGKIILSEFPNRVMIEKLERNSVLPGPIWLQLRNHDLDWVQFLGDDDLLKPEEYSYVRRALEASPHLTAIGFSGESIDQSGHLTGNLLMPILKENYSFEENLALSFHAAPFVWPALVFRFKALPREIYSTRYVSDWWVGLSLVRQNFFSIDEKSIIQYREHPLQESALTTETRKRFEAQLMLDYILDKGYLDEIVNSTFSHESFFNALRTHLPVYGDPRFGGRLLIRLNDLFASQNFCFDSSNRSYFAEFSALNGAFLNMNEFPRSSILNISDWDCLNVNLSPAQGLCQSLREAIWLLPHIESLPETRVYCEHVDYDDTAKGIQIDCHAIDGLSPSTIQEIILRQISETNLEQSQITFFERKLLFQIRRIKRYVRRFISRISVLVRRVVHQ